MAFESIGPTGGEVKEGLCGAPIVHDDEGGGVAGFVHLINGNQIFPPILDSLIDQGWAIVYDPVRIGLSSASSTEHLASTTSMLHRVEGCYFASSFFDLFFLHGL